MNNVRGCVFMVISMAAFALEDMLVKSVSQTLPIGVILVVFGMGGMLVFLLAARYRQEALFHPGITSPVMIIRSACEIIGRLFFTLALAFTPLSSTSAILQATPLVVMLGAVVFFGESVGYRRWIAAAIGFSGVLLIIKPGLGSFEPNSLFAVIATLGFAGRDLGTKGAPKAMSSVQLGVYGFLMLTVAGLLAMVGTGELVMPTMSDSLKLVGIIFIGVIAYFALTGATRTADISVVAPFRYTRLVFAMALGMLVFSETPDALTLVGSLLIVGSGLFSMYRGRVAR